MSSNRDNLQHGKGQKNIKGWTLLHMVAGFGDNPDGITRLVNYGADLESKDINGHTSLHQAAAWNMNLDMINRLLDLGANPEARNRIEWTLLHHAASFNHNPDMINRLLDLGADSMARMPDGETTWDLVQNNMAMQGNGTWWQRMH